MNEHKQGEMVRHAVDMSLSGLQGDPWLAQRVLANVKGEVKVKKKLSVGFVLLIVLVLAAVTALAAALLWEQQVVPMKEIEQTEGDYANWPVSQKQVLIRALIDSGNIEESSETARLFDDSTDEATKHAIADQLVLTLTGHTDVNEISVDIITYAIMGPTDTWTPEQRVWWQQVTEQFYGDLGNPDTLVTPSGDVISETEAIAIAKEAILAAWNYSPDALDKALPVADLYVTEQRPNYRRWNVQFKLFREGSDSYVERIHVAVVDEHGQVIDDPDVGVITPEGSVKKRKNLHGRPTTPLFQTIDAFAHRADEMPFKVWPLELKAEYSEVVGPQVRTIVESGDLTPLINGDGPDLSVIASSTFTYGMPGEQDMKQNDALGLAIQTIMGTYDLDSKIVALYDDISIYFDITDPDAPLWKFLFIPESPEKFPGGFDNEQAWLQYKVEINSRTGEVTKAEEFKFQLINHDLEYDLKLY